MIPNHNQVFNYFESKFQELSNQYGFGYFEAEPCSVNSKEDLHFFVQNMMDSLFKGEAYAFVNAPETRSKEVDEVNFIFNNQAFSLKIDPKFGHIDTDFFQTIKLIGKLSGKHIFHKNPMGIVSGKIQDMRFAWNEGFPIHLDEIDFLHKTVKGKRFKWDEVGSTFTLNQVVDVNYYEETILTMLNTHLSDKGKTVQYQREQIKLYTDSRDSISISLNGDYSGSFKISDGHTILRNSFINQLFLLSYWSVESGRTLIHRFENGNETPITVSFSEYVSTLGIED